MTYVEALEYLGKIRLAGSKLGLANVRALAERVGNPHTRLRFIHIAGTNGKGSVAAFLESALRAGGLKVGLYTSPHLIRFNERIQINREPIADQVMTDTIASLRPHIEALEEVDQRPTYFEVVVVMALLEFDRQGVDWVVWETGLGGRLDATNIVTPEISIITNIGLDHTAWLGDTIDKIAQEKAGIIKPHCPCIVGELDPVALEVIQRRAEKLEAPLISTVSVPESISGRIGWETCALVPTQHLSHNNPDLQLNPTDLKSYARHNTRRYELSLLGRHQCQNAACAHGALSYLAGEGKLELSHDQIRQGFATAQWAGRFDRLENKPPCVIDGAHNVEAVRAAVDTWLRHLGAYPKPVIICGFVQEKPVEEVLALLLPLAGELLIVGLKSKRSANPQDISHRARQLLRQGSSWWKQALEETGLPFEELEVKSTDPDSVPVTAWPSLQDAWGEIRAKYQSGLPLFFVGSLFLAGEALARWTGQEDQLLLNERLGPPNP